MLLLAREKEGNACTAYRIRKFVLSRIRDKLSLVRTCARLDKGMIARPAAHLAIFHLSLNPMVCALFLTLTPTIDLRYEYVVTVTQPERSRNGTSFEFSIEPSPAGGLRG